MNTDSLGASPVLTDAAGQVLAAWASRQHRMRDIVRRPRMTQLEKARLWTWAHRELGDEACRDILSMCDWQLARTVGDDYYCICGDVLGTLLVLP
jgi:hypothetical protein